MEKLNRRLQYPYPVYIFVYGYFIFTIGLTYVVYKKVPLETAMSYEVVIATILLIFIRKFPIRYLLRENLAVFLNFFFPTLLTIGIYPIWIVNFFSHFLMKQEKDFGITKNIFNFTNRVASAGVVYLIYTELRPSLPFHHIFFLLFIILLGIIYSFIQNMLTGLVIYLDKKVRMSPYSINIYITNIVNGTITFYLYQSLGLIGLFIAVGFAYLFSIRSRYLEKLVEKQSELFEAEKRMRMIFDTIDYGIITFDMERRVKMANPMALRFLQTLDLNPIGKKISDFNYTGPKEIFSLIEWTYVNKKNYHQKKVPSIVDKDTIIYLDIYTYPYTISDGKMAGIILLYKNVTDEQIIRRQLIEADKLSHLGQIAAGKVHEIKNPLTTVRGYLQFLRQKVAKGEQINLNYFDIALQEIDRTNELIHSLLILSKQSDQEENNILLDRTLKEIIHLFEHQLSSKNIKLTREIENDLIILGVENHLKQIFINLLLNAIDAVELKATNPCISITASQDKNHVHIKIKDNGIGINVEDVEKLKMPFFTTKESGTGLGLSVTYKLVEEHNGSIHVESEKEQGTTFSISFPKLMDE